MIPGEIIVAAGDIILNEGRKAITLTVANTGDRPVQIGSHYHFAETNAALDFDRKTARGMRLDIAAGTAVRFEPGQVSLATTANMGIYLLYVFAMLGMVPKSQPHQSKYTLYSTTTRSSTFKM